MVRSAMAVLVLAILPGFVAGQEPVLQAAERVTLEVTVRFDFDLTQPIKGKDVLIVEDIVDTGLSMSFLLKALEVRGVHTTIPLHRKLLGSSAFKSGEYDVDFLERSGLLRPAECHEDHANGA